MSLSEPLESCDVLRKAGTAVVTAFDLRSRFPGYTAIRRDRPAEAGAENIGGGLLALLVDGLWWTPTRGAPPIVVEADDLTEMQDLTVYPHRAEKIRIAHLYIPPALANSPADPFKPAALPDGACTFGDLNAHHESWDPTFHLKSNRRGRNLRSWADETGARILNSGESTRIAAHSGTGVARTAPDVSIVPPRFRQAQWHVAECAGSDHSPVIVDLPLRCDPVRREGFSRTRWAWKRADWSRYRELTEQALAPAALPDASADVATLNGRLTEAILGAARAAVPTGNGRPGEKNKEWWSPQIKELANLRRQARKKALETGAKEDAARWSHLNNVTKRVIRKAKQESWQDFATTLDVSTDPTKIFNTIKAMDGRIPTTRSMPVMYDGERVLTDGRDKAELLARRYADVSRLESTDPAAERRLKSEIERRLREEEPTPAYARRPLPAAMLADLEALARPFQPEELRTALRSLRLRKAPGPDGVANEMLTHLGEHGRAALLRLASASWEAHAVPAAWRLAEIIPLLKKGKDAQAAKSYRPVSLTSCVAKLVERLVRARLQHLTERWGLLHHEQAGYRRCRSCEEQLTLISQFIADGLERGESTVMLAVDFTAAFDRAKRELLYKKMLDKGFPPRAVRWVQAFLTRRRFRVRCGDLQSSLREAHEGFPQGTVLGPLLWDLFFDDIIDALKGQGFPKGSLEVVCFADDVTVLIRGTHLPTLYKRAQEALDRLSRWEVEHQARVSLDKTTVTVFVPSRTPLPAERRPKLWYPDQAVPAPFTGVKRAITYEARPKLLGLTYDERLTFQAHVTDLRPKIQRRAHTLGALNGTKWGCNIRSLRALHLSYVQSKTEYGLAAYGPFATEHTLHPLETEQYHAACKISGCPKSTRRQVALLEAGLESVAQRVDHKTAVQYERSLRLPAGNRARAAAEEQGPAAPKRRSWRTHARGVLAGAELDACAREPLATFSQIPPWEPTPEVTLCPDLVRPVTRKDPPAKRKAAALETLAQLEADAPVRGGAGIEAYTDGSVLDPREMRTGGGGYTLVDAGGATHRGKRAAGARCTSFRAELTALVKCLDDIIAGRDDTDAPIALPAARWELRIALDSRSAIQALARGPANQTGALEMTAWERLIRVSRTRNCHVTVQYVPGHVQLEPQEEADTTAKAAARECQQGKSPIPLSLVTAVLRAHRRDELQRQLRKAAPEHVWSRATDGKAPKHAGLSRALQRQLSQLRAGRCPTTQDVRVRFGSVKKEIDVPKATIGTYLAPAIGLTLGAGCEVVTVAERSGAAKSKIKVGWKLERVGKTTISSEGDYNRVMREHSGEKGVKLYFQKE
eukprot:gene3522-biopygen26623